MGWLQKNQKVEQGTEQWQKLNNCLHSFAKDMWGLSRINRW
jgi:hypothetical protein